MKAENFEKFQPLGRGVRVKVSAVHRFSTDAVLLADFAAPREDDIACDLGTGCGIIPLLWCRYAAPKSVTAVDIQSDAVSLLRESVAANGLEGRISPLECDLKALPPEMGDGFTLVTMNPPYKTALGGVQSPVDGRVIARHEVACTLEDIVKAAARLLKFGGRLCMCHRPERLSDLICLMRTCGVEPKRLRTVSQREGKAPSLVLVEGRKGAKAGLNIDAPFFIEKDASYSPEMERIYRDYNEEVRK